MTNLDDTEPAVLRSHLTSLVAAVLAVLAAWGVDISANRQAAVLGLLAALGPIVSGWLIRRKVWSPASHHEAVEDALRAQGRAASA